MTSHFADIRKLSYYMPLGNGECGACGRPIVYNLALQVIKHEEPNADCPEPWVKVARTPEEEAAIEAGHTKAVAEDHAARDRHAWMLTTIADPVLRALVEAHAPDSDDLYPDCVECPRPPSEFDGSDVPTSWPCPTWTFISDRMETP